MSVEQLKRQTSWIALIGLAFFANPAIHADQPSEIPRVLPRLPKAPAPAVALHAEARKLEDGEKFDLAAQKWEKFIEDYPDTDLTPEASYGAGSCRFRLGHYPQAAAHLKTVTTKWSNVPELAFLDDAHYWLGLSYLRLNKSAEAIEAFERAAKSSAKEKAARAQFMIGEAHWSARQYEQAIATYERVIQSVVLETASRQLRHWHALAAYEAGRCTLELSPTETLLPDDSEPEGASEASGDRLPQVAALARGGGPTTSKSRAELEADTKRFFKIVIEKHPHHPMARNAARLLEEVFPQE